MSIRLFILISILVHVVGGSSLYFYYNPLNPKEPELVKEISEDKFLENLKANQQEIENQSPKPPKQVRLKQQAKKLAKKESSQAPIQESATIETSTIELAEPSVEVGKTAGDIELEEASVEADNIELEEISEEADNIEATSEESSIVKVATQDKTLEVSTPVQAQIPENNIELEEISEEVVAEVDSKDATPEESSIAKVATQDKTLEVSTPVQAQIPENNIELEEVVEEIDFKEADSEESLNIKASIPRSADSRFKSFFDLKQKIGNPSLAYPDSSRKARQEGNIVALYYVSKEGLVDKVQLEKSSGYSELDNFTLRALSRYEFLPNQETWVRHEINFQLRGQEQEQDLRLRTKN